jgi:hypothetical protein
MSFGSTVTFKTDVSLSSVQMDNLSGTGDMVENKG